jgi:putative ABC transport system permease protein
MALIPLKYSVRNLRVRWVTTALTVLVTALVVGSTCILFAMVEGLRHSQTLSGDPLDLLVLRKGSSSETNSGFALERAQEIATLPGIARGGPDAEGGPGEGVPDARGKPLVAAELLNIPVMPRADGTRANIIVRGVEPTSHALRPHFRIIRGRFFEPGRGECIVAVGLAGRFRGASVGDVLQVGPRESYQVVGLFSAGGSAAESEVWVDRPDLEKNMSREGSVTSVQLRAESPAARDAIAAAIRDETRFGLDPRSESEYYASQQMAGIFLTALGVIIAVLLSIGAMFAAANTMFAAVKSRTREIGTMRALGFGRFAILASFLGESLLLCLLGGLLGFAATMPLSALTFGITDFNSFSERTFHLRFGPLVFAVAFGMTLAMGLFGGLFPAVRAVRLDVVKALREL